MDDNEVDESDWRGLSTGDTDTELVTEESAVAMRCVAGRRWGRAVVDIMKEMYIETFTQCQFSLWYDEGTKSQFIRGLRTKANQAGFWWESTG